MWISQSLLINISVSTDNPCASMKHRCELCMHFCAELHELRLEETGQVIGWIGSCCLLSAAQRIEVLALRHPQRLQAPLNMQEFRELTRRTRPPSSNRFGHPRRTPPE